MMVPAALAGMKVAFARLRSVRTLVTCIVGLAVVLLVALLERNVSPVGAADRALASAFRFVVPLTTIVLSGFATGPINLRESAWSASRFGHARSGVGVGIVIASMIAAAVFALVVALVAL